MTGSLEADVAIIGSGVAGALAAARLAESGLKVVVLEAGKHVDRQQALNNFWEADAKVPESAYRVRPEATFPTVDNISGWYQQNGPDLFKSTYLKVLGGTTWHWLGTCFIAL